MDGGRRSAFLLRGRSRRYRPVSHGQPHSCFQVCMNTLKLYSALYYYCKFTRPAYVSPTNRYMKIKYKYKFCFYNVRANSDNNNNQLYSVEPSAMPEESLNGIFIPIVTLMADVVEPSFSRPGSSADADGITTSSQSIQSLLLRFADRNLFSSFFSSLLAGWQFPTIVTITR